MKKKIIILAFMFTLLLAACGGAVDNNATAENVSNDNQNGIVVENTNAAEEVDADAPVAPSEAPDLSDFIDPDIDLVETDSGLQYQILIPGDGEIAENGSFISVHYTGWLSDGTKFDSSVDRGAPLSFTLGDINLITGWNEGMLGMQVGEKRLLILPYEIAFGEAGAGGGLIPPFATIVFEVDLLALPTPESFLVPDVEVVTTDTGLVYQDLVIGEGTTAVNEDTVVVHYTGWLVDGTQFDSSVERNDPLAFTIGADMVMPGWDEGVAGMQVGGERLLIIPPELALGELGGGDVIPPNATLVFMIKLVSIPTIESFLEPDIEVVTTDTGLIYQDLVVGDGAIAEDGDLVVVHYTGWLVTGNQFDSSVERGTPFEFTLAEGAVIAGWDEGVAGMTVGSTRLLIIPSDLGYGEFGSGSGAIPPGATLIFEVELLEIK